MSDAPRKKKEEAILILQNQLQAGVKSCPEFSSQKTFVTRQWQSRQSRQWLKLMTSSAARQETSHGGTVLTVPASCEAIN